MTAVGGVGDTETGIANGMVGVQVGDVSGQVQETALGQLAAVVAEQAAVMPVTAKKSAPAPVSEMDMEAAKVDTEFHETVNYLSCYRCNLLGSMKLLLLMMRRVNRTKLARPVQTVLQTELSIPWLVLGRVTRIPWQLTPG